MKMEEIEKVKEYVGKIENLVNNETDKDAIFLKDKLKIFSEALTFTLKYKLFEDYNKSHRKERWNVNEE